jgi:hypothetical protein
MDDPKPIHLTDDGYWWSLGWPAVARDEDGHVLSTCSKDGDPQMFNEWLRECFENGWSVTNLTRTFGRIECDQSKRDKPELLVANATHLA